jgi:probable phosphoglycerate mutase
MTTFLLIRHGRTGWLEEGRLQGWVGGVSLSEKGRWQATRLAQRIAALPLVAIYSSPLDRARETAQIIANGRGMQVTIEDALGEIRVGELEGRFIRDLDANDPYWREYRVHPAAVRFPGGESLSEVQERAVSLIERLRAEIPSGAVALVSHADVIRAIAAHYMGIDLDHIHRFRIDQASLSVLKLEHGNAALSTLNCTCHLEAE